LEDCQRECRQDGRCQAYTFIRSSRECFLKSRVNNPQRNGDAVTGYKTDRPFPGDGGGGWGGGRLTEETGQDRRGNDYDSFRVRDLNDCQRECRQSDRCRAYTFIRSSRECFLKDRVNSAQRNGDAVTGYKTDSPGGRLTEEVGLDRKGNDYSDFRVRDLEDCQRECRQDGRCQAYTYIRGSRQCYLKDRINSAQRNGDAVTGYKQ
ncbi:MAG TPA: PAN/Apple domain-containing protein, partial [Thermoanaerobaculia bacterium]|nr:PAN/Apple domain-containing protein [Thermoanaerobaculia bacterium]